jgi:hypothetical protein
MSMFCCTSRGSAGGTRQDETPQVPREDVQLLQVGIAEREHLGQEHVQPHVIGEQPSKIVLFVR